MNSGKLEIEIPLGGPITSKTSGLIGASCLDADSFIKELGDVETKLTEDFYKKPKPNEVLLSGLN
jgi:hypothetical protein